MKEILIKEIRLLNFKGIRDKVITFSKDTTIISGWNGTGKTTVADAITWLLFNKDSKNREKFNLKTLDKDSKIIYKLPHEVSGIFSVDGEEIRLTQRIEEKWRKNANGEETIFIGNECVRLFNDVPCTEKEYKAKIAEICKEEDFKFLTNPSYFCSRDAKEQKAKLMEMAGEISDHDIVAINPEFEIILKKLGDKKTLEELKKEIGAKRKTLDNEIAGLPERIDENKRKLPELKDWDAIQSQIKEKEKEMTAIEELILDRSMQNEAQDNTIRNIYSEIGEIREQISKREREISKEANKDAIKQHEKKAAMQQQIFSLEMKINSIRQRISSKRNEIDSLTSKREVLITEYKGLNKKEQEIHERTLIFREDQFICPTCQRQLELEDIESKQDEIRQNFEAQRARDLKQIAEAKQKNMAKGSSCSKAVIAEAIAAMESLNQEIIALEKEKQDIMDNPEFSTRIEEVDIRPLIENDSKIAEYERQIEGLQKKIKLVPTKIDLTEVNKERSILKKELETLKLSLLEQKIYEETIARIKELENQYSAQSREMHELSHIEYLIGEFSKAKNREVARRIDNLFSKVKFQWIEYQINGGEKETCQASIDGIPFNSLNHAGQINAGLDIINAISDYSGMIAPIMIDNSESCNELIPTKGQKILFRVGEEKELTIINE